MPISVLLRRDGAWRLPPLAIHVGIIINHHESSEVFRRFFRLSRKPQGRIADVRLLIAD
jgi:hypothetical protein